METPIYDFVRKYADSSPKRMHMPGHKGMHFLGCESLDITEINGADVLYSADGIIAESENNAGELFGTAHTFYSTEGSSLSIKAMLALAAFDANNFPTKRHRPLVVAARNVHKAFIYACALLDLNVEFIEPNVRPSHVCQCAITAADVEKALENHKRPPCAVYVTSPDYLGNILDIKGIAEVCHRYKVPLLVDNAHGAYLAFTDPSQHPIALGADMCCDSAHKTLTALTGAGYLHVSKKADVRFAANARRRLSLFASTSPSYLILQSLDLCNKYLAEEGKYTIPRAAVRVAELKRDLRDKGFTLAGNEPLKLTLDLSGNNSSTQAVAEFLKLHYAIECEFVDNDYIVMMLSPQNSRREIDTLETALRTVPLNKTEPREYYFYPKIKPKTGCSIREAVLAPHESVNIHEAVGRICASPTVSCPPAVPIAISGEIITKNTAEMLQYYGIKEIDVVIERF